jgi:predicted dehydrogenase
MSSSTPNLSRRGFLAGTAALFAAGAVAEGLGPALQAPAWTPATDRRLRIGVVGGRFGLAFHWHEHPNCTVVAVSDLLPDRRAMLQGRYECERAYPSLEELVKDPEVEAVALFTPAPDHARHTLLCFAHGKHVISACPACMTLEEAEALAEAKRRTGLRYMSAETSWYRWETITARRLFRQGAFGEMVYSEGEYFHPAIGYDGDSLSRVDGEKTWRYGFPPLRYPTHSTGFLTGVTGEQIVKVSAIGLRELSDPAYRDNAYGNPYANGTVLALTDQGHPFRFIVAWNIHSHGERATWFGSKGALYMPGHGGQPFAHRTEAGALAALPDYWHEVPEGMRYDKGHGNSHAFLTHEFVTAMVEDREPEIDLDAALALCVPGIVAEQSCNAGGAQLDVPRFNTGKVPA